MEAAADVLLGMAAEKIQTLVICLCTIVLTCTYTHTPLPSLSFVFPLLLSFSDKHKYPQSLSQFFFSSYLYTPLFLCLWPPL